MAIITPTAVAAAGDFFAASFFFEDSDHHVTSITLTDSGGTWSGSRDLPTGSYKYSFTLQSGVNQGYTVSVPGTDATAKSGSFSGSIIVGGTFNVA